MWCAPGGFCDRREHPVETVVRETLEETGWRVEVTGFIGIWLDDYDDDEVIAVAYYAARAIE